MRINQASHKVYGMFLGFLNFAFIIEMIYDLT